MGPAQWSSRRNRRVASNTPSVQIGVPLGEVVGGYRIVRLIGAGSTSHVYLGEHARLGRRAAIKVLHAELVDNPQVVHRMLTEAKVVNDIHHPNIVDVTDFVDQVQPRRVALVMEYIAGPSVDSLRTGAPIPWRQALGIARQLVDAVAAAHRAGVIHRDLKPENLLLATDPREASHVIPQLKVVDFGIAKVAGPYAGHQTATQTMLGTPAYMAPEQIAQSPPPSGATDVFAVGEILYELLAGKRAYGAARLADVVRQKLRGEIPDLPMPPIPGCAELEALIRRCLAYRPEERPSLDEVVQLLEALQSAPVEEVDDLVGATTVTAEAWNQQGMSTDERLVGATQLNEVVGLAGQRTRAGWRPEDEDVNPLDDVTVGTSATHPLLPSSDPTPSDLRPSAGDGADLEAMVTRESRPLSSEPNGPTVEEDPDDPTLGRFYVLPDFDESSDETSRSPEDFKDRPSSPAAGRGNEIPTRDVVPPLDDKAPDAASVTPPASVASVTPPAKVRQPRIVKVPPAPRPSPRSPPVAGGARAVRGASTVFRPKPHGRSPQSTPVRRGLVAIERSRARPEPERPPIGQEAAAAPTVSVPSVLERIPSSLGAGPDRLWLLVGVPMTFALAMVVYLLVVPSAPRPFVPEAPREAEVVEASVQVRSQPPEAFVEDAETGEFLGKTPIAVVVPPVGTRKVRVFKVGFTARVVELTPDAPSTWVPLMAE